MSSLAYSKFNTEPYLNYPDYSQSPAIPEELEYEFIDSVELMSRIMNPESDEKEIVQTLQENIDEERFREMLLQAIIQYCHNSQSFVIMNNMNMILLPDPAPPLHFDEKISDKIKFQKQVLNIKDILLKIFSFQTTRNIEFNIRNTCKLFLIRSYNPIIFNFFDSNDMIDCNSDLTRFNLVKEFGINKLSLRLHKNIKVLHKMKHIEKLYLNKDGGYEIEGFYRTIIENNNNKLKELIMFNEESMLDGNKYDSCLPDELNKGIKFLPKLETLKIVNCAIKRFIINSSGLKNVTIKECCLGKRFWNDFACNESIKKITMLELGYNYDYSNRRARVMSASDAKRSAQKLTKLQTITIDSDINNYDLLLNNLSKNENNKISKITIKIDDMIMPDDFKMNSFPNLLCLNVNFGVGQRNRAAFYDNNLRLLKNKNIRKIQCALHYTWGINPLINVLFSIEYNNLQMVILEEIKIDSHEISLFELMQNIIEFQKKNNHCKIKIRGCTSAGSYHDHNMIYDEINKTLFANCMKYWNIHNNMQCVMFCGDGYLNREDFDKYHEIGRKYCLKYRSRLSNVFGSYEKYIIGTLNFAIC